MRQIKDHKYFKAKSTWAYLVLAKNVELFSHVE